MSEDIQREDSHLEESLLKFPCQFPIKAMGSGMLDLEKTVLEIIQRHTQDVTERDVHLRPSRNGRFVSITIVITAQSRAQLDAIYQDMTSHKDILMAF